MLHATGGVEIWAHTLVGTSVTTGYMQHRNIVRKTLRHRAHRIFRSRAVLHGRAAQLAATGHAHVTVGDMQGLALLAHDDRAQADFCSRLDEVAVGEGGDDFYALLFEDVGYQVGTVHFLTPGFTIGCCGLLDLVECQDVSDFYHILLSGH